MEHTNEAREVRASVEEEVQQGEKKGREV